MHAVLNPVLSHTVEAWSGRARLPREAVKSPIPYVSHTGVMRNVALQISLQASHVRNLDRHK